MGDLKKHLPCAISTEISCAASNFYLSMYKLHKDSSTLIFDLKLIKSILLLLSKNKSTMYQLFDIVYHTHITHMTIEPLHYQPLRFIISLIQVKEI